MLTQLYKNCNHMYHGKFCPDCGQKAATHEIDFNFVMHEVPYSAFHLSKGILFTSKELFTYYQLFLETNSKKIRLIFREIFCYFTASILAIVLTFTLLGVISEMA